MSALVSEIIADAQSVVGEVAGPGVQVYSEDRMRNDVGRAFNMLFKKRYWEQYSVWTRLSLDGTTGLAVEDTLQGVRDYEDFSRVNFAGHDNMVPELPHRINPLRLIGSKLMYWTSLPVTASNYDKKKLQFYPKTAVDSVDVYARFHPLASGQVWADDKTIYFDKDMIVYGTAYATLSSDSLNPDAADSARSMMELRYRDILGSLANRPIAQDHTHIPDQWHSYG